MDKNNNEGKNRTFRSKKQLQNLVAAHADDKQSQGHDGLIVGVGASAGGLQAMLKLFDNIPELTGLTFVVIQHLDANNASALADFLSKVTAMPVIEVKDNTVALPNHVYIITPGTELTISCGVLTVTSQNNGVKRFTPIDTFLESLALDKGSLAIGVVLSGTGADGSRGLKEIRLVGGINFAQEPKSAEYDEMPRSAIATSIVDFVLPPSQIASELLRISQTKIITGPATEVNELFPDGAEALDRVFALLRKASGINFAEYKQIAVKRRMVRRMALLKIDKLDEYALYLRQNNAELIALKQDMLINVTRFFRESEAFDNLKTVVFPSIISASAANTPIRLWVAGCSTGEEAYSLAIILLEFLEENAIDRPIHIFATDINDTVIEKARVGIYPKSILADVSLVRLSRFFVEVEQGYQVVYAQFITKIVPGIGSDVTQYRTIITNITGIRNAETEIACLQRTEKALLASEERLKYYASELVSTNSELKAYADIVAHDLRTPMVNLKGFSRELGYSLIHLKDMMCEIVLQLPENSQKKVKELMESEMPEALKFIETSVDRMSRMVDSLLKLAHLGRRKMIYNMVDIGELVAKIICSFHHQIEMHSIHMDIRPLPQIKTDQMAIEQIFSNLLDNAIRYLDPDRQGEIRLSCTHKGDEYLFSVEDNGCGITANDLGKMFESLRRVGKQDVPGDGMGLAYVRVLVKQLGGKIWCESEPGVGTKIFFTIHNGPLQTEEHRGL